MSPTTAVFRVDTVETLRDQLGDAGGQLLGQLIRLYLTQAQDLVTQIEAAVASADAQLLAPLAHKLRGSTATLGGDRLADVCQRLEEAPTGSSAICDAETASLALELRREYDELTLELADYQQSLRASRVVRTD